MPATCSSVMLNHRAQITCLYDMDIPRPDNFNEAYLYEGTVAPRHNHMLQG